MPHFVDGFVHPIPRDKLSDYQALVTQVARIWKEHGALDYWECVGDEQQLEGTRSFADLVGAKEHEVVMFGWVVFESREARDQANTSVPGDPRMEQLMADADVGFDASRMAYGGFQPIAGSPA